MPRRRLIAVLQVVPDAVTFLRVSGIYSWMEARMLTIEKVDTENKKQVKRFVELPYRIYADCPQWVPPLNIDAYNQLNRKKHPFHEHSRVDFYLAVRDGRDVGRIAAIENKPFNQYHNTKKADFYLFECENDMEAATALFATAFEWARAR